MGLIKDLQKECHEIAKSKGFWEKSRNEGELIALIHSELSEALEALRYNNMDNLAEEMADVIIRVFDFCESKNINLEEEILKKMEKNKHRDYKHGKLF